jgi:heptosyltransferase-1
MSDERFLIVRLTSLSDVIHTLPVLAALRDTFLRSRIDWLIDARLQPLLEGNPDLNETIVVNSRSARDFFQCRKRLREGHYTAVLDAQGLYKSALLAKSTHAEKRIGFSWRHAREGGASLFYSQRVKPTGTHIIDRNLALAAAAGARLEGVRFPIFVSSESQGTIAQFLQSASIERYFVLNPGGSWKYNLWPAERYGELALKLWEAHRYRIIVNCGPGDLDLGETVVVCAGLSMPIMVQFKLPELMALLMRADLVVSGDAGPLHLAAALGTPVVALYGPTDPARNGPYSERDILVRNVSAEVSADDREDDDSKSMLSITVDQVFAAIEKRLENKSKPSVIEIPNRTVAQGSGSAR